ncbi:MAG: PecA family PE domain-processing aspartic protease, partial [Mycobacterium sp.]
VLGAGGPGGAGGLLGHQGVVGAAGGQPSVALSYTPTNEYTTVGISVGGGPITTTEIDTGSSGLVIPITEVNADNIGQPTGATGMTEYGGWGKFYYTEYKTSVNFGNGLVTAPTDIGVITKVSELINGAWTDIPQSEWSDPKYAVNATMGVCWGYNSGNLASPVHALPGSLDQGLLLNEPAGQLVLGTNPITPVTSVSGWYTTTLDVQVSYNGVASGVQQIVDNVTIDSGGVGGNVPDDVLPTSLSTYHDGDYLPTGTTVSVYTSDGQTMLYTTTITSADYSTDSGPDVTTKSVGLNTGIFPFLQGPIYFSYTPADEGTTTFDYAPAVG